ncbi:hemerythrin domain-containing protein [Agromyces intestinalis]|nr:hemerythrin domain-containing protein [Agromyces intestinalis]
MTTRMPSTSGPLPAGETAGCDTSDILIIHRIFRWGFREAPRLVREVRPGDTERAAIVADTVDLMTLGLHVHHEGEDEAMWDRLEHRRPACGATVDLMREQHRVVAGLLERVPPLVETWRADASIESGERLAAALDDIGATLGVHLGQEEADIVPVAAEELSQREWDEMAEHGRTLLPKDRVPIQLGLMIDAVPAADRDDWSRRNLPAPVRLLWLVLLKRKYTAWQRATFPTGMPALV